MTYHPAISIPRSRRFLAVRKTNEVLMRFLRPFVALSILVFAAAGAPQEEGKLSNPDASLITLKRPGGWTTGVRLQLDRRQFDTDATVLDTDILHAVGFVGVNILPFLNVGAELGAAETKRRGIEGTAGMEWAITAKATLLEHTIRHSPIMDSGEWLLINVEASYMHAEADFRDGDFDWTEFTTIPSLTYVIKRRRDTLWYQYEPRAMAVYGGLAFSAVEGDYGRQSFHEEHAFGIMAGTDLLLNTGWVASIDANIYSQSDREISFGLMYNF